MRKVVYLFCLTLLTGSLFGAAPLRPAEMVQYHKAQGHRFSPIENLFSVQSASLRNTPQIAAEVTEGVLLNFNQAQARQIMEAAPEFMTLNLPFGANVNLDVELVKVDLFTPGFNITNSEDAEINWTLGTYYRGVIKDLPGSIAAVSFIDGEVVGMFSGPRIGNFTLGALQQDNPARTHIMYNEAHLVQPDPFACGTEDDGVNYSEQQLHHSANSRALTDCIRIFYEVDYDIYQNKGTGTVAFITAEFNEIATLYANESLNYLLSEVNVITASGSAYSNQSSSGMLNQFKSRYNGFNGDMAHMVSYKSSGGIAAGFAGLCNSNPDNSMCFSNIYGNYNNVPTYSWDIMVQTHEMGHLNGSRHTHACVWNGNGTAIDGCAGGTEGSCPVPGFPSGGGTIMSYCHIQSVGINFSNGFGPQPGNAIRNATSNASCLSACDGGGGGGGLCDTQVSSFPYTESFESGFGGWTQATDDDFNWSRDASGTPSSSTGPSAAFDGSWYLYTEASSPNYPSRNAKVLSPCFDLSGASNASFSFACHMYGATMGTLLLQASDDAGSSWTTVWSRSGDQGNAWFTQSVNLDSYAGGDLILRFSGTTTSSWTSDFTIDDVSLSTSGGGGGGSCPTIDFTGAVTSYGGGQDANGTFGVQDGGATLYMANNTWKDIAFNYTVTSNTVVEFEFRSTAQGEIHGIGFDTDESISSNLTFKVHGTQNWGITNYDNYSGSAYTTYTIPVGSFYTGSFSKLFFVNDNDGGSGNTSYFRNVKVYESGACNLPGTALSATPGPIEPILGTHGEYSLDVYPSPVSGQMYTRMDAPEGEYTAQLMDLNGRTIWSGAIPTYEMAHDVSHLPAGIYMMKVQVGEVETLVQKVIKTQ